MHELRHHQRLLLRRELVRMTAKMGDEGNIVKEGSADLFEPNPAKIPMKEVGPKVTWTNWDETPPLDDE